MFSVSCLCVMATGLLCNFMLPVVSFLYFRMFLEKEQLSGNFELLVDGAILCFLLVFLIMNTILFSNQC